MTSSPEIGNNKFQFKMPDLAKIFTTKFGEQPQKTKGCFDGIDIDFMNKGSVSQKDTSMGDEAYNFLLNYNGPLGLGGSDNNVQKLETEVKTSETELQSADGQKTQQDQTVKDIASGMETAKSTISDVQGQISSLKKPDESEFKNDEGEVDDAAYNEAMQAYEKQLEDLEKQLDEATKELDTLTQNHQEAEAQLQELQGQLDDLKGQVSEKQQELNQAKQSKMESNKTDSATYKNDGNTTANDVFANKGLTPINDRATSDDVMKSQGFDVSKIKPENVQVDGNGITYNIDGKYYRVSADEAGMANVIRSEVDGNNVKTDVFSTGKDISDSAMKANGNGELNNAQRTKMAKDMIKNGTEATGLRSTGNKDFDNLSYSEKLKIREEMEKLNASDSNVPSRDGSNIGKRPDSDASVENNTNTTSTNSPEQENKVNRISLEDAQKLGFNGSQDDLNALRKEFYSKVSNNEPGFENISFVDYIKQHAENSNNISNQGQNQDTAVTPQNSQTPTTRTLDQNQTNENSMGEVREVNGKKILVVPEGWHSQDNQISKMTNGITEVITEDYFNQKYGNNTEASGNTSETVTPQNSQTPSQTPKVSGAGEKTNTEPTETGKKTVNDLSQDERTQLSSDVHEFRKLVSKGMNGDMSARESANKLKSELEEKYGLSMNDMWNAYADDMEAKNPNGRKIPRASDNGPGIHWG